MQHETGKNNFPWTNWHHSEKTWMLEHYALTEKQTPLPFVARISTMFIKSSSVLKMLHFMLLNQITHW